MAKLAIKGGKALRTKPFSDWPVWDDREEKALLEVLHSGKWWYGEKVKEFENKFAAFQNAKFGITCANGTVALEISLLAAGIGAGDEVILPPYTFIATASSVLKVNAIPIFVDVESDTFNIDPGKIEEAITEKTRGIIPVHFFGYPADMDRILEIAKKHKLKVIEDAAHGWGTKWRGKGVGAWGLSGCFSFQYSKNITSSEGGIILTDDYEIAALCRSYSNVGRGQDKPWYEHYLLGSNHRMTEFQAALLVAQLTRLPEQNRIRQRNASFLDKELSKISGIKLPREEPRITQRAYHGYNFRYIASEFGNNLPRGKFLKALEAEGIPALSGYPHPLYKNPLFLRKGTGPRFCPISCPYYGKEIDYSKVCCPAAEKLCNEEAVWFSHTMLLGNSDDMTDIVEAIKKIQANLEELQLL